MRLKGQQSGSQAAGLLRNPDTGKGSCFSLGSFLRNIASGNFGGPGTISPTVPCPEARAAEEEKDCQLGLARPPCSLAKSGGSTQVGFRDDPPSEDPLWTSQL